MKLWPKLPINKFKRFFLSYPLVKNRDVIWAIQICSKICLKPFDSVKIKSVILNKLVRL